MSYSVLRLLQTERSIEIGSMYLFAVYLTILLEIQSIYWAEGFHDDDDNYFYYYCQNKTLFIGIVKGFVS
jgi:hypothetical protein